MNKPKLNYIVDFFAFIFFIATSISGLAIFFFLPSGVRQSRLQEFAGIQKGTWVAVHDWSGIIFILLIAIHFALHWDWIFCMTKNIFKADKCETKTEK
jgi:protein-S-isoprenylcysteine O-methyltransferase Ste14